MTQAEHQGLHARGEGWFQHGLYCSLEAPRDRGPGHAAVPSGLRQRTPRAPALSDPPPPSAQAWARPSGLNDWAVWRSHPGRDCGFPNTR